MVIPPQNLSEIQRLVKNQVPESIHLDYKASPALLPKNRDEIAKDVSAFANSDGGWLVYGIEEEKETRLPLRIDEGVDPKWNREWLEQLITSNITPRIEGVDIREFPLDTGRLVLCVIIPRSDRGPHQAGDKRYYKRFNFASFPMEHYEAEDVRNRRNISPQLVALDLEAPGGGLFEFILKNIGNAPALDIKFQWAGSVKWDGQHPPEQFRRGISSLGPGRVLHIAYGGVFKLLDEKPGSDPNFRIDITYRNGATNQVLSESFQFDLADYRGTLIKEGETTLAGREVGNRLRELTQSLNKVSQQLEALSSLATPSGLQLSRSTIQDLQHIARADGVIEKRPVSEAGRRTFQEMLGIDHSLAWRLERHFQERRPKEELEKIEGMTPDVLQRLLEIFHV